MDASELKRDAPLSLCGGSKAKEEKKSSTTASPMQKGTIYEEKPQSFKREQLQELQKAWNLAYLPTYEIAYPYHTRRVLPNKFFKERHG